MTHCALLCPWKEKNVNMPASFPIKRRQSYPDTFPQGFPFMTPCTICSHFNAFPLNCSHPLPTKFRNPSIHELTLSVAQRCFSASSVLTNPNPKFSQETEFRTSEWISLERDVCFLNISDIFFTSCSFFLSLARQKVEWSTCRFLPE